MALASRPFGYLLTAMVTPMAADGSVDIDAGVAPDEPVGGLRPDRREHQTAIGAAIAGWCWYPTTSTSS